MSSSPWPGLRVAMLCLLASTWTPSLHAATSAEAELTTLPHPLPGHPGNIHLEGEGVRVRLPTELPEAATRWRLVDERGQILKTGQLPSGATPRGDHLSLGSLGVGWYRLELGPEDQPDLVWTTAAVLRPLSQRPPEDTPVAVDAAVAWFARADADRQRQFANLAALAGVRWVRDRLRWSELQPAAGELVPGPTTYDTAAEAQWAEGLEILQVFHDTPPWARQDPRSGGQFAPDLRHLHAFCRALAVRFHGKVSAWEPWNEANVTTFGGHTVDQMCSWQKAAWLGFKAGDPDLVVGWNATAAVPTAEHTHGVLANETWPYFDTYNIHSYDWAHGYSELWEPARRAAAGRPLWTTEADRGTPHLKNPPWFDQDPRLERLKAEYLPQSYAASLYAGAERHFHFILGHYHEPQGVQFGLLRLDLTPRPAYVALAAIGRFLAGARSLGRWQPDQHVHIYAFRAVPDGHEREVLVAWAEQEVDWDRRGLTHASWRFPASLQVEEVFDHLGRSRGAAIPFPLTSAPVFIVLPPGQTKTLPIESPPPKAASPAIPASPIVLQMELARSAVGKVEDRPWSEGHTYLTQRGTELPWKLHVYNFGPRQVSGQLRVVEHPEDWTVVVNDSDFQAAHQERTTHSGSLRVPRQTTTRDGWITLEAVGDFPGHPVIAWRVRTRTAE